MMQRKLSVLTWIRLVRTVQSIGREGAATLENIGFSGAQFDVLVTIAAQPGTTQQALADELAVTKGNISQLLEKLEGASLIERRQVGVSKKLYLTPTGQALVDEHLPKHDAFIDDQFSMLTDGELAQLNALLRKLNTSKKL